MGDRAIDINVAMTAVTCGECGGSYAITSRFHKDCHEQGKSWNCPYCRVGWGFAGRGELAKLREERDQATRRAEFLQNHGRRMAEERDHEKRRAATYKGHLTRYKTRVGRGVCPCCDQSFEDLRRHMETQHPEQIAETTAPEA